MAKEEKNSQQSNSPLSIVFADIDHFKRINDTFSHAVGDETLLAIAKVLTNSVPQWGSVSRWGGEEFVILLVNTDLIKAETVCQSIRTQIENYNWSTIESELAVTASFGVAQLMQNNSIEETLNSADELLYIAKKTGRNKVVAKLVIP